MSKLLNDPALIDLINKADAEFGVSILFTLVEHTKALESMIKKEFENGHIGGESCIVCDTYKGHSPACKLARLLQ